MIEQTQQYRLLLTITNSSNLESGKLVSMTFEYSGGIVGSAIDSDWIIQDLQKNIQSHHFRVEWRDNYFCMLVLSSSILLNNSRFTSKSGFIRLKQNDKIEVGNLIMIVSLDDIINGGRSSYLNKNVEEIIVSNIGPLQELLSSESHHNAPLPSISFPETNIMKKFDDPLLVLDDVNSSVAQESNVIGSDHIPLKFPHKPQSENRIFSQDFMELPKMVSTAGVENITSANVVITPLIRELHTSIPISNSQEANDFLEEIGKTMYAVISGLLVLQQEKNNLSDKHLRPIEDNPLRLNLDYESTIDILFGAKKSPVHLSAPAAVTESLNNVLLHNKANTIAITVALTSILEAFSPITLLKRFENYRRSNDRQEATDAWAWDMYKNYYQELISKRQLGFEKLFWEVYSQAYDKALREHSKD